MLNEGIPVAASEVLEACPCTCTDPSWLKLPRALNNPGIGAGNAGGQPQQPDCGDDAQFFPESLLKQVRIRWGFSFREGC